jgi:hexosaminidase
MTIKPVLSFFFLFTILINCSNPAEIVEFKGVIPHPDQLSLNGGYFNMNKDIGLRYSKHFTGAAGFLTSYLKHAGLKIGSGDDLVFEHDKTLADDAYELEINPDQIVIRASTDRGAFYGVQSFRQVLPVTFENGVGVPDALSVPCLKINDAPEFNYQGMHLDVGRHMYSVEFIKK